ncbi:hypothetical protein GCK32_014822, partial [Trichostrongylus colubriformis]
CGDPDSSTRIFRCRRICRGVRCTWTA